ncbi:hypothetical protein KPATCC21470_8620 [Kitasatospora purpeofusca]
MVAGVVLVAPHSRVRAEPADDQEVARTASRRHQRGRSLQETLPGTPAARGRTRLRPSSRAEQAIYRALSAARAPVERSIARPTSWQILLRARCSPTGWLSSPQPSSPWNINAAESHCRSGVGADRQWPSSGREPSHDQTSRPSVNRQTGELPSAILVSVSATESKYWAIDSYSPVTVGSPTNQLPTCPSRTSTNFPVQPSWSDRNGIHSFRQNGESGWSGGSNPQDVERFAWSFSIARMPRKKLPSSGNPSKPEHATSSSASPSGRSRLFCNSHVHRSPCREIPIRSSAAASICSVAGPGRSA